MTLRDPDILATILLVLVVVLLLVLERLDSSPYGYDVATTPWRAEGLAEAAGPLRGVDCSCGLPASRFDRLTANGTSQMRP